MLVDADARRRLDAGEAETALGLADETLAGLRALDPGELERVASSLAAKRRRSIEAAVPHTARLWPGLGPSYLGLLAQRPATVEALDAALGPGVSELARLLPDLRAAARADLRAPVWAGDLLALELARARVRALPEVTVVRCAYPVHELLLACDRGWLGVDLEPAAHEYRVEPGWLRWRALAGRGP